MCGFSFFGKQEGEFELVVRSISAVKKGEEGEKQMGTLQESRHRGGGGAKEVADREEGGGDGRRERGWFGRLASMCVIS